jgi:hypothetical protein
MTYFLDQVGVPWRSRLIMMQCLGLLCIHPSIMLEYHLLELEEFLRSWETSTNLCAHAQQGIQM